jgi:hypothetical protein
MPCQTGFYVWRLHGYSGYTITARKPVCHPRLNHAQPKAAGAHLFSISIKHFDRLFVIFDNL